MRKRGPSGGGRQGGPTHTDPMDLAHYLRIQARANRLANHRLHAAMAPLARDELHAPRTSFFPSLIETLNHILMVDVYYIAALHGEVFRQLMLWHRGSLQHLIIHGLLAIGTLADAIKANISRHAVEPGLERGTFAQRAHGLPGANPGVLGSILSIMPAAEKSLAVLTQAGCQRGDEFAEGFGISLH